MAESDTKNTANNVNSNILDKIMGSQTQSGINDLQPQNLVSEILSGLKERDREIISKRFGLNGVEVETLEGIGKKYSLTRERVRQIEMAALGRIRAALERKTLTQEDLL